MARRSALRDGPGLTTSRGMVRGDDGPSSMTATRGEHHWRGIGPATDPRAHLSHEEPGEPDDAQAAGRLEAKNS